MKKFRIFSDYAVQEKSLKNDKKKNFLKKHHDSQILCRLKFRNLNKLNDFNSAEEVERCKQKDLLEEMLEEMTGEFPSLSRVFVQERDLCLAHSIQIAVADAKEEAITKKFTEPPAVVAVVGIGHVAGMSKYFETVTERDVKRVME